MSSNLEDLIMSGPQSERPLPGIAGRLFFNETISRMERDNGTTWTDVEADTEGVVGGGIQSIVAGTGVTVDDTDPENPVISVSEGGGGGGGIASIVAGDGVAIDDTDPVNPVISVTEGAGGGVQSVVAGFNVSVDITDPQNPVISALTGGAIPLVVQYEGENVTAETAALNFTGNAVDVTSEANVVTVTVDVPPAGVSSITAGSNISVDNTDPANPVINAEIPAPSVLVDDEGVNVVGEATRLDFQGEGVTVTDGGFGRAIITIPGGGSGGGSGGGASWVFVGQYASSPGVELSVVDYTVLPAANTSYLIMDNADGSGRLMLPADGDVANGDWIELIYSGRGRISVAGNDRQMICWKGEELTQLYWSDNPSHIAYFYDDSLMVNYHASYFDLGNNDTSDLCNSNQRAFLVYANGTDDSTRSLSFPEVNSGGNALISPLNPVSLNGVRTWHLVNYTPDV